MLQKIKEENTSELNKLLNQYADDFVNHHRLTALNEIKFYSASFKEYMKKEALFKDFLQNLVVSDDIKLIELLGYDKQMCIFEEAEDIITERIKKTLYNLIKIRVHEDIQSEIEDLQYNIESHEDDDNKYVQNLKKQISNFQRVLSE